MSVVMKAEIVSHRGHREGLTAQQPKVVGNIARNAAKFAPHLRYQEGDIQYVNFIGKNMFFELVGKHHDGVIGQGATDKGRHVISRNNISTRAFYLN